MKIKPNPALKTHITEIMGHHLCLLSDKAIYIPTTQSLLVSDVHLGKAETFQAAGIPISHQVNHETLLRLKQLVQTWQPKTLYILGDLFHARKALVDEVIGAWQQFLTDTSAQVILIVGNHDRSLVKSLVIFDMGCQADAVTLDDLVLSHEPEPCHGQQLNICGHMHPVVKLRSQLDSLRLPCFYFETQVNRLTMPSFGAFTGGYEVDMSPGNVAYISTEEGIFNFGA